MRILSHVQHDAKTIPLFRSANIRRLNLHRKNSTECVTLTKIQEKQEAKSENNDLVYQEFSGTVKVWLAVDMWPNDKSGKNHRFYCVGLRIARYMHDYEM